ncbi:SgcJ/EcaC family oxidoreductase [Actinomadura montaniterrae]|uniref:SgcJ/EcaC family oxidoreductase n=1 Tax=Actinomadura montaniterrae TaxID=1803903 RepID=A0A6L3VXH7_9ACTN|nr:SgcJ/EcaC family oxidoreductase [Actinomadura montaniterrae]
MVKSGRTHAVRPGGGLSTEAGEQTVAAVFEDISQAWADGDAGAFTRRYAEQATVILPGVLLRDRIEVRTAMAAAFATCLKGSQRVHAVRSVRFLRQDVAVVITRSATMLSGQTGATDEQGESATWTLCRNDGRWLIEALHS